MSQYLMQECKFYLTFLDVKVEQQLPTSALHQHQQEKHSHRPGVALSEEKQAAAQADPDYF